MCSHYILDLNSEEMKEVFGLIQQFEYEQRPETSCNELAPIIRGTNEGRTAIVARWGFIPYWNAKGLPLINASAETVDTKRAFRSAFQLQRCLIPATSYIDIDIGSIVRKPIKRYRIRLAGERPFAIAGLWDTQNNCVGQRVDVFTMLTTQANDFLRSVPYVSQGGEMPVILRPQDYNLWLSPRELKPEERQRLFRPWEGDLRIVREPRRGAVRRP